MNQLVLAERGGEIVHATINSHLPAGALFARYIDPRCRVVPHHDDVKSRPNPMLTKQPVDSLANFLASLPRDRFAVQNTPERRAIV